MSPTDTAQQKAPSTDAVPQPADRLPDEVLAAIALIERADLITPMTLRVAATIRLADHLDRAELDAATLADRTGTHPRPLRKVLDHLVALDVLSAEGDRYRLAPGGRPLLSANDALGARPFLDVRNVVGRSEMALVELLHTVTTGAPAYEARHGRTLWDDLVVQGSAIEGQDAFRRDVPMFDAELVVDAYDWSGVGHVVDVGGNTGALAAALTARHPHLRATVLDLPCFADPAAGNLRAAGVSDRATFRPGDFFGDVPAGADVYLLSAILADWDDEAAVRILRTCAAAAGSRGRLLLAEVHLQVVHPDPVRATATQLRLEASMGHPDRTPEDIEALAARAGLQVIWRGAGSPVRSLIEVAAAGRAR